MTTYRKRKSFPKRRFVSKAIKRYVAKAIDRSVEDKFFHESLETNFGSITSGWNELALTAIPQGDGQSQRIGNRIRVKSVEIKGVISGGADELLTDDPYNCVRFILADWNDKQTSPCATAALGMNSLCTKQSNGIGKLRQKFLDKYIPLSVTSTEKGGGDGYTPQVKNFNYYKRFKRPLTIYWSSDTGDYPNHTLVLSAISDSAAVTHPGFIAGYVKLTYEDA